MEINYKRRQRIALIISFIILWYVFFVVPKDLRDDSDGITATCTVTKAYTRERGGTVSGMNDIRPKGIFETEECGTLTMIVPPEGRKIPEYVETVKPGKNTYSMSQIHHLKRNRILRRPALKKLQSNNLQPRKKVKSSEKELPEEKERFKEKEHLKEKELPRGKLHYRNWGYKEDPQKEVRQEKEE